VEKIEEEAFIFIELIKFRFRYATF